MTTRQWTPASVLQLEPNSLGFTCIGHAKTQGRRCRNAIAYANRQEAEKILLQISRLDPLSPRVDAQLEELATRLLCRRWHQDQAAMMKRRWQSRIEDFQDTEAARRADRLRTLETINARARSPDTRGRTASGDRERTVAAVASILIESSMSVTISMIISDEAFRRRRSPEPQSPSQREASLQEPTSQNSNSPPSPSPRNEQTIHTPTVPPQEHPTATNNRESEASNQTEPSRPISQGSTQSLQPQQNEISHHPHQDRRSIEGDCSICCEDVNDGGDSTWCRAQCGQNFHTDCVNLWHASQEADERVKTCPYW